MNIFSKSLLIYCVLAQSLIAADFDDTVWPFFEKHCVECHDDITAKGGLDLYSAVKADIAGAKDVDRWTAIFDRVHHDEMPPPKKKRPDLAEKEPFLGWVRPNLTKADAEIREVVQRRLNRVEYENTMHDLLGIDVDLKDLLPEDQSVGGFDNNGAALAISAELFERYLEAARRGLDAAIQTGQRPESKTTTIDSLKEVTRYLDKQYALIDDRVTVFMKNRSQYSKISTRAGRLTERGRYRFKFSAAAVNTETPLTFSVMASDFKSVSATYKTLGYFEVGTEPKTFEIEAILDKGFAIQFFAHGLPSYVKDPTKGENPGIGWSSVEIIGPIVDAWPPKSHSQLIGGVDLENGTLADAEAILRNFMPRVYRRPVSGEEIARPLRLVKNAINAKRPFQESLRVGLEAVLCSPNFLFLRENEAKGAISSHELASRLSYFLWNSMPDDGLFAVAENGTLSDPPTLAGEVERMLKSPKSARFIENFTDQWLKLRDIDETAPDSKLYKEFDELLQVSMVDESRSFFKKLLTDDLPITNFIDSDFVMLNRRLAEHYQIEGGSGVAMQPVSLPENSVRGGILTQAAVLKVTANGTNTSPVIRGVWVLENILGKHIPPPPANISGIEPDIREATTIREQLDLHRDSESCASCHQYIDPPGFALESFDPIGGFRENYLQFKAHAEHPEKGWGTVIKAKPVDASGTLSTGEKFTTIQDFKALLMADSEQFANCLTERLTTYALGRELGFSDREPIDQIRKKTKADGNGFRTLISNIVTSPIFSQP